MNIGCGLNIHWYCRSTYMGRNGSSSTRPFQLQALHSIVSLSAYTTTFLAGSWYVQHKGQDLDTHHSLVNDQKQNFYKQDSAIPNFFLYF